MDIGGRIRSSVEAIQGDQPGDNGSGQNAVESDLRSGSRGYVSQKWWRQSNRNLDRMSVSVVARSRFEPTARHASEFRRTIGGNIADLRRVGEGGGALPLPIISYNRPSATGPFIFWISGFA